MKTDRRNVKRRRTTVCGDDLTIVEGSDCTNNDPTYEVQGILGSRIVNGKEEFHVKWKGFGMADCTWEPEENIHAKEMLAKFRQQEANGAKRKRRNLVSEAPKRKRETRSRKSAPSATVQEPVAVGDSDSTESQSPPSQTSAAMPPKTVDEAATSPPSNVIQVPVSSESVEASTEEPNTCVTISSSEIVSSSWISPEDTPSAEVLQKADCTGGLISNQDVALIDESRWKVEHLGPPPSKGVAGHWALVVRNDGVQEYIPIQTVRQYFPNKLFDYLLARIQFRKDD